MSWQRRNAIYKMFEPLKNNTVHTHLSGGRRIRDCGITLSKRPRAFLTPFRAILRERVLPILPMQLTNVVIVPIPICMLVNMQFVLGCDST
jgi:hypothetical protein